jgi:acetate kinase
VTEVFVVNAGSSSLKYQVVDVESGAAVLNGLVERIGEKGSKAKDVDAAMRIAIDDLGEGHELTAVGHRVVHGGTRFTEATVITDQVEKQIDELSRLAPLHNPVNLVGIRAARKALPDVPQVAVFDTAFHRTLLPEAYTYALDAALAKRYEIRRYGFHGTSFKYVAGRTAKFLGRPLADLRMIVLHLGNGASACAIRGGVSIDTSMGMTPLEGLVMGTRSGDLDPAILGYLNREAGFEFEHLDAMLNKESGLLGLTGSGDMRDVQDKATAGDADAEAALAVYCHRIRHYIGAYFAELDGIDALVFTAGVGEHSMPLREQVLVGFEALGISVDPALNRAGSDAERAISPAGSPLAVLVIPTNEELEIARQSVAAIRPGASSTGSRR